MIRVFCDESENESPRIFTVGGWVASPSAWSTLDVRWREMLAEAKPQPIASFHMADLVARKNEFSGWTAAECDRLIESATDILLDRRTIALMYGVAATVVVEDFRRRLP